LPKFDLTDGPHPNVSYLSKSGVTNVMPAGTRSPARTKSVARRPVLKITSAWSVSSH